MSVLEGIAEQHGEEARAAAQDWLEELVVLTFRENRRGGDPIAHTLDGRAVFPDKYRDGERVMAGESWLCSVAQKGDNTFFAAPLARIDEGFFRGLVPAERRRVAEAVWTEHRDVVLDEVRELLMAEDGTSGDGGFLAELEVLRRERDELRERLRELTEQYDEAAARLAAGPASQKADGQHAAKDEGPFPVMRPAAEVLECDAFGTGAWHGHVSPDGRMLFLKQHTRGPLSSSAGRIVVPGLARILGDGPVALEARFDPRHGGFFIPVP